MPSDLPMRQKSQRLVDRIKAEKPLQHFAHYKQTAKSISSANELLPGLNDILDAFEALPLDLVKYFTLLKEIDAKCINSVPLVRRHIHSYLDGLHPEDGVSRTKDEKVAALTKIRRHVHDVIPCLEEKMHVTAVAADVLAKHMRRINGDYAVIVGNNEIPENVRIGSLNHRAIVLDPLAVSDASKLAQSQRSESRREALAAKKVGKDTDDDENGKRRRAKEPTPLDPKKRRADEKAPTPFSDKKKATTKPKKERDEPARGPTGNEPTYCYCNQVSFGEMVGCDGDSCKREWFHLPCIGFKNPPKGKWYCDDCQAKVKRARRI